MDFRHPTSEYWLAGCPPPLIFPFHLFLIKSHCAPLVASGRASGQNCSYALYMWASPSLCKDGVHDVKRPPLFLIWDGTGPKLSVPLWHHLAEKLHHLRYYCCEILNQSHPNMSTSSQSMPRPCKTDCLQSQHIPELCISPTPSSLHHLHIYPPTARPAPSNLSPRSTSISQAPRPHTKQQHSDRLDRPLPRQPILQNYYR